MSETEDTFEIIWCDAAKIRRDENRARQLALKQHNETYMKEVYAPAMAAIRERCEKLGHQRGDIQDNGMGHWWIKCYYCGKELERGSDWEDGKQTKSWANIFR